MIGLTFEQNGLSAGTERRARRGTPCGTRDLRVRVPASTASTTKLKSIEKGLVPADDRTAIRNLDAS